MPVLLIIVALWLTQGILGSTANFARQGKARHVVLTVVIGAFWVTVILLAAFRGVTPL